MNACTRHERGVTLIELLVGVAIIGLLVMVAAPSFARFIDVQRLRSINAALVTDIQFVRTEATSRNVKVALKFQGSGATMTCYAVVSGDHTLCNCTQTPGSICGGGSAQREIRTVQVLRDIGITVAVPASQTIKDLRFDPATGRVEIFTSDDWYPPTGPFLVEVSHPTVGTLRTAIEATGRPSTCSPGGTVSGVPACT